MPVLASAPLSAGPSVRSRTIFGDRQRERDRQPRQQQPGVEALAAEQPRHRRGDERARQHPAVEPARAVAPEPHGQRALARPPVGLEVAHVVDDEDRRGQQPDRDRPARTPPTRAPPSGRRTSPRPRRRRRTGTRTPRRGPRSRTGAGRRCRARPRGSRPRRRAAAPSRRWRSGRCRPARPRRTRCRSPAAPAWAARARPRSRARGRAGPRCRRRGARRSSRWRGSVPTWMNSAPSIAAMNVSGLNVPWVAASAVPTSTGATAAGSVRGRAAISQMRRALGRSAATPALTAAAGTWRSPAAAWP